MHLLELIPGQDVTLLVPVLVQPGDTMRLTGMGVSIKCFLDFSWYKKVHPCCDYTRTSGLFLRLVISHLPRDTPYLQDTSIFFVSTT